MSLLFALSAEWMPPRAAESSPVHAALLHRAPERMQQQGLSAWSLSLLMVLVGALAGCDQLGIETPQKTAERQQAEAKAIGSACRHATRAIEDCYTLNPKADKSAVFEGWREMDEYMRENKLEGITPVVPRPAPQAASKASAPAPDEDEEAAGDGSASEHAKGGAGKKAKGKGH